MESGAQHDPAGADHGGGLLNHFTQAEYVNAMSHFYRGELGRMMIWRQRLDLTTNWAVGATSTLAAVGLSQASITHLLFLVNMLMAWTFLWIEGRRYRFYDVYRARARQLETHFILPVMLRETQMLEGDWKRRLAEDLVVPTFKISIWEAVGRRLSRNYVWLFVMILVAWITKVLLHHEPVRSWGDFYRSVGDSGIPAWLVIGVMAGFYVFLAILMLASTREREASGEVVGVARTPRRWRI